MLYTLHAVQLALIQRLKKGGGGGGQHIEWPCSVRSFVCANNAWFSFRGGGGGSGGMLPQESLDHMRVLLRPSRPL